MRTILEILIGLPLAVIIYAVAARTGYICGRNDERADKNRK